MFSRDVCILLLQECIPTEIQLSYYSVDLMMGINDNIIYKTQVR